MKIVIDARESGTSTGRYIDKLVEYLHELQPKYEVVVLTKPTRLTFMQTLAPQFIVMASPYKEFTLGEQLGFWRQLVDLKADLVHFGMVQQPVLYRGLTVTTMHDLTTLRFRNPAKNALVFTFKQLVYRWVNKHVARSSAALITPTEFVKRDVVQYTKIAAQKITVTLESADKITEPAAAYAGAAGKQFLLYVGRPQPHKNLERLLDAFAVVQQHRPDLYLVLAGKTDKAYSLLQQSAERKNIKHVIFTDWVSDGQLRWLYEHATAYVFPSLSEGFGLPALEAMHYGLPVISSQATCLPEVYGDAAAYFDPLDIQSMAETIEHVLNDPTLRQQLIDQAATHIQRYSWRRMAQQTLAVYDHVLRD
ncbi:MAG: glycosyltransferase family 1 protein [Candidatus Saccharimonadales bacterium]